MSSVPFLQKVSQGFLFALFFFYFWPLSAACGILVPQPGIEPMSPAVEVQSLNHWTAKEVLICPILFFFFFLILFIYLFMAVLGLRFCARALSSRGKWGPLFIAVRGPLTVAASLVAEHRLQTRRLSNCGHGPSCSAACGILPDQGSNPCPLHWQADSQSLRHQGSPALFLC